MSHEEIIENLKKAVSEYDTQGAASWARRVLEEKIDPIEAINALIEAVKVIGDAFGRGELWLPDLFGATAAMQGAMPVLEDEIKRRGGVRESLGTVVIGTVFGDIHDIGKTMVSTMLAAEGFIVHDLGVNITTEGFIEAVKSYKPDILAMSSLLTTTAPEQRKVIEMMEGEGMKNKVKVIIGGGAITSEFAKEIGADGYEVSAPLAPALAKRLLGLK